MNIQIKIRLILMLVFVLLGGVKAEQPWVYPPMDWDDAAATKIDELSALERDEELIALAFQLAQEHSGTSLGAEAYFIAARTYGVTDDLANARSVLDTIAAEYPGSRFELRAKRHIIGLEVTARDFELYVQRRGELAAEFGAPTLDEITSTDDHSLLVRQTMALSPEIRQELSEVYDQFDFYLGRGETEKAIRLAKFGRAAIDPVMTAYYNASEGPFGYRLRVALADTNGVPRRDVGSQSGVPEITIVSPEDGDTTGSPVSIEARITTGDYSFSQVALGSLVFLLDGSEVSHEMLVDIDVNLSLAAGEDFETISMRLEKQLSPGLHTCEIRARSRSTPNDPPTGAAETIAIWSFTVTDNPPEPTSITLPTTKDSTLVERNQHENEGANPLLTLEKIQGKATRSAVSFDLDGVNLNGLTSAKLVLTVDPSESVTGWGNGETVTVSAITTPWVEGNGRHFGLNNNQQDDGSGSGTTWFAAVDTNIDNNSSNSPSSWNGASVAIQNPTAPALVVTNHFDGQLEFDVTNDILNGNGYDGWLVTKDRENKGSKVSFYSKESGDPTLAPQLILDFGDSTAQVDSPANGVLAKLGLGRGKLESKPSGSELPSFRERLQESPVAAYAGETLVGAMAGPNPALKMASKVAYRAWLEQGLG